jgi:hypothetical protein
MTASSSRIQQGGFAHGSDDTYSDHAAVAAALPGVTTTLLSSKKHEQLNSYE